MTERKAIENKIEYRVLDEIPIPELWATVPGVTLHEVNITYWPNHKKRGRKPNS